MWTPATRRQHNRDHLRYGSDLTDAGVGDPCVVHASRSENGATAPVDDARDRERDLLCAAVRLQLASAAQGGWRGHHEFRVGL